ncbi:NAD-binding protein [Telmatocola sphagniphila]|uniref:NAD-binding protein n=1 Tax=Telmatocola sphagniphila TaxID=1123043 RepID=A0A8E6B585_9BACT|nr:NAD-binding protein [Telmatocola sphagniphila]QVL32157.1 NAD-binding protein [Telmatocola sphagniphila]
MRGPVLLCGLGTIGWRILDFLRAAGVSVVAIDTTCRSDDTRLSGIQFISGDFREEAILRQANIAQVQGVLIVTSDDLINISTGLLARRLNPDARIVLRMFNQNLVNRLGKTVKNMTALSVSALSAPILAISALSGDVMAAFALREERRQVAEIEITETSSLANRAFGLIDPTEKLVLISHQKKDSSQQKQEVASRQVALKPGDRIVVCGVPSDVQRLREPSSEQLRELLWAGKVRRFFRVIHRTFRELERPVQICLAVLVTVVVASTMVYHWGVNDSWPDALYHTISLITTGSELGAEKTEGWFKVFVSLLKIFSIALIAAFTAIVTNYLIKIRLGAALEARRIPDGNHIVICGLGNVGFRVLEELLRIGEESVVILEKKADNPFITAARRKGAVVVIGDGTLPDVLKQCKVETARSVIVATSLELVNLEIALIVAELNPKQRIVIRLGDSLATDTVRQAANVGLALSVTELAAPAFVAALFGDRVMSIFPLEGKLQAVMEWKIADEQDMFHKQRPRDLAQEYHLTLLERTTADLKKSTWDSGRALEVGESITFILPLQQLEQLLQTAVEKIVAVSDSKP